MADERTCGVEGRITLATGEVLREGKDYERTAHDVRASQSAPEYKPPQNYCEQCKQVVNWSPCLHAAITAIFLYRMRQSIRWPWDDLKGNTK